MVYYGFSLVLGELLDCLEKKRMGEAIDWMKSEQEKICWKDDGTVPEGGLRKLAGSYDWIPFVRGLFGGDGIKVFTTSPYYDSGDEEHLIHFALSGAAGGESGGGPAKYEGKVPRPSEEMPAELRLAAERAQELTGQAPEIGLWCHLDDY
ncbi:MAG: hypothetical protein ACYCOU_16515 [Sulfobacillus sp.]